MLVRARCVVLMIAIIDFAVGSLNAQAPFLRGDVDGDGLLTIADAVLLSRAVVERRELPCADAADFTDNGEVQLGDAGLLIEHLFKGSPEPAAPFGAPGVDPTPDALGCAEFPPPGEVVSGGRYSLAVEPQAGAAGHLRLRVFIEPAVPAFAGRLILKLPDGWASDSRVLDVRPSLELASLLADDGVADAAIASDGALRVLWLLSMTRFDGELPPGGARQLLDVTLCPGTTRAGSYGFEALAGELSSSEGARLDASVTVGDGISLGTSGSACAERLPSTAWVRPYFYVSDAEGEVGGVFRVSFYSTCNIPSMKFLFRVRWDPEIVRIASAEAGSAGSYLGGRLVNYDGFEPGVPQHRVWHTVLPGWSEGFAGIRMCAPCSMSPQTAPAATVWGWPYPEGVGAVRKAYPVHEELHHIDLLFEVLADARPGPSYIYFLPSPGDRDNVYNSIDPFIPSGNTTTRYLARPQLQARVEILPRSGSPAFVRGDTDRSGVLTLTDPLLLLAYLFQSAGSAVSCEDAADSDDNGRLELTDAIYTLLHLFAGGPPPPPPFPDPGPDPTDDALGCAGE